VELPWLSRLEPQLLAILRIIVGLLFLEHALSKFFAIPVPFPVHPMPPMLIAAGAIELIAGSLVTLGLFTRLAAFIASGEMAFAYFIGHFPKSPWPDANMGEPAILFCFVFLYIAAAGPGTWSIDGLRNKNAPIR